MPPPPLRSWQRTLNNDENDKNVFRLKNELANDINDKNHFVNDFVNDFANNFVNTKVNKSTKSRNDNRNRKYSTKWTKLIENKSVVLFGVYLRPFCSTLLSKITSLLILILIFFKSDEKSFYKAKKRYKMSSV